MTTLREAAAMALEALEDMLGWESLAPQHVQDSSRQSLQRLREALAQPEPEPVAWMHTNAVGERYFRKKPHDAVFNPQPVYLRPEPLTDRDALTAAYMSGLYDGKKTAVKVTSDGAAAVDQGYFWQPMRTCPLGVKVQLLGAGGVAAYGHWNGHDAFWQGWAPLPKKHA